MARLVHVLFLQLLLAFTALTEPVSDVFVEEEQDAVLPCDKVQDGQEKCNMTTWIHSNPKSGNPAVEFITLGKMHPDFKYKDRFTLTETCSLAIKKVQIHDGLDFTCRQFDSSGRTQVSAASIKLSVVSLVEHDTGLNCYVSSPRRCTTIQVRWLYNDTEITKDQSSNNKHEYYCGASLSYHNLKYDTLKKELFTCEISHNRKTDLYKLKPGPTVELDKTVTEPGPKQDQTRTKPGLSQDITREKTDSNSGDAGESSSTFSDWWWTGLVAVAVFVLTVTAVILVKRRKKKENPQKDDNLQPASPAETEPEDGVSYASVSYIKKQSSRPEPRTNEEETVTYSSVKTPASHDMGSLYASVKKK